MKIMGFMTGTSLDGIDMAVLDTDGEAQLSFGPFSERPLPEALRTLLRATIKEALNWPRGAAEPAIFDEARSAITAFHLSSAKTFLAETGLKFSDFDALGVHGQTVMHERPKAGVIGRTMQLFDPQTFANETGVPVVGDFRFADVAAGGEGAPLAPVYHQALVRDAGLKAPVVVVNLGGVANITLITDADPVALDTGPANGLMDQWMRHHGAGDYDADGVIAAKGRVDEGVVASYLSHPYFKALAPKSLDRYDFTLEPVKHLSLEDGMATLSTFTLQSLLKGIEATGAQPKSIVIAGGGRHNNHLIAQLKAALLNADVRLAEDLGWRGGAIEAEAFAYMAARRLKGLPISFPTTTGIKSPMTGGNIYTPQPVAVS
jgi:anhydro-N-acetylmuramic acid kinase